MLSESMRKELIEMGFIKIIIDDFDKVDFTDNDIRSFFLSDKKLLDQLIPLMKKAKNNDLEPSLELFVHMHNYIIDNSLNKIN